MFSITIILVVYLFLNNQAHVNVNYLFPELFYFSYNVYCLYLFARQQMPLRETEHFEICGKQFELSCQFQLCIALIINTKIC